MLTLLGSCGRRDCGGVARRDFLKAGTLGLGALGAGPFGGSFGTIAAAAESAGYVRDRAVVLLFLCGGPSQLETFDPKPDATDSSACQNGVIRTALPGECFGAAWPRLAERASRLAIVRQYSPHGIADHAQAIRHVLKGGDPLKNGASLGAMFTRVRGGVNPATGMPNFAEILEEELEDEYRQDRDRMRVGNTPGGFGLANGPFAPSGGGPLLEDLSLTLPLERLSRRRELLASLDGLRRLADASPAIDSAGKAERQAIDLLLGDSVRKALDLAEEDPAVRARYDTSGFREGYLEPRRGTLGARMLLARRLVEAGCGFVVVGMAGWDNHGNGKHPGVKKGMELLAPPVDHAVSAFLDDLRDRGLEDKVLLVVTGEFGRTPQLGGGGGRDHWPDLCPLLIAGGGTRPGVYGRSDRRGARATSDPTTLSDLLATLAHAVFDMGRLRLDPTLPGDLIRSLAAGTPISGLLA